MNQNKKYSVVFSHIDPSFQCIYRETNSIDRARRIFEEWVSNEVLYTIQMKHCGGEWEITLYEHTPDTKVNIRKNDDDEIYDIGFENSKELDSYSYVDAIPLIDIGDSVSLVELKDIKEKEDIVVIDCGRKKRFKKGKCTEIIKDYLLVVQDYLDTPILIRRMREDERIKA